MKVLTLLERAILLLLQIMLIAIVLVVCWQVFSRYVLSSPSAITEELARFLLIWITILGTVFAYRKNSHIGLDLFYLQTSGSSRFWFFIFIHLSVAIFAIFILLIGGISLVHMTHTLGQISAVMGINISYLYLIIPISGLLLTAFSLENILFAQQILKKEN